MLLQCVANLEWKISGDNTQIKLFNLTTCIFTHCVKIDRHKEGRKRQRRDKRESEIGKNVSNLNRKAFSQYQVAPKQQLRKLSFSNTANVLASIITQMIVV